jgi:hypothetical protein
MNVTELKADYTEYMKDRRIGHNLIANLREEFRNFSTVFIVDSNDDWRIFFTYLGRRFEIRTEIQFINTEKGTISIPSIATYVDPEEPLKAFVFVFGWEFDPQGTVKRMLTAEDFSLHYIKDFVLNAKKVLYGTAKPLILK